MPPFAVSTAFAQAPVVDANGGSELEQRLVALENMMSRTEMQHRLQTQLDNMQMEVDQLRGAVEVNTNELQKVLERQRELYLEIDKPWKSSLYKAAAATQVVPCLVHLYGCELSNSIYRQSVPQAGEDEAYENAVEFDP